MNIVSAGANFRGEKQSLLYSVQHLFSAVQTSVIGPDISFYQDDNNTLGKVDFTKMKTAGARFVICRAGQNSWPDPDFADYWRDAKSAGIPRGSYWFYDSRYPPEAQADLWLSVLGADRGELPMWADLEESYGGTYKGSQNWRKFIERVRSKAPDKEIGVYTAYGYWSSNCPVADRAYFGQFPLWVANYGVTTPKLPPGWSDWLFWQFTSTGDGPSYGVESKGIDLNYFNGNAVDFYERFPGGSAPPPPVEPEDPRQVGTIIVGALNVRTGPGTQYSIIEGATLLQGDQAFGNVDPGTNWMRISWIQRAGGGTDFLDGWASAYPNYMTVAEIGTTPGGSMQFSSIVYSNGVNVIIDRLNEHSWYRAVIIPPSAIKSANMFKPAGCRLVEDVAGDLVFNFSPFNSPCTPNMGVRVNGIEYQIYDGLSQGSFAPFFWWDESGRLNIDHRKTVWKTLTSALQGWRYLVQNGIKNPNASSAWDIRNPVRCVGRFPDGSTVLLSVAGRGYLDSPGATLHECAALLMQMGCDYALDGDGGGSVSDVLRYSDGSADVFRGTDEKRGVPAGGVIKLQTPLDATAPPPPPASGKRPFVLDLEGYKPYSGELEPDDA